MRQAPVSFVRVVDSLQNFFLLGGVERTPTSDGVRNGPNLFWLAFDCRKARTSWTVAALVSKIECSGLMWSCILDGYGRDRT